MSGPAESHDAVALTSYAELADMLTNLGLIVREARRARRISLRSAAAEIDGVDFSTLSRVESGQQGTRVSAAIALLRWLDRGADR